MSSIRAHPSLADPMRPAGTASVSVCPATLPALADCAPFRLAATIWTAPVARFAFTSIIPSRTAESVVAWTPAHVSSADPTPFAWPTLTGRLASVATDSRAMPTSAASKNRPKTSAQEMTNVRAMPFAVKMLTAYVSASILASPSPAPRANRASSRPAKPIANVCPTLSAIRRPERAKNQDVSWKNL